MSKKKYSKQNSLTPGKILVLVAIAALVVYFGSTFPKNISAYTPDPVDSYSIKYVSDITVGGSDGYLTGSFVTEDAHAGPLSEVLTSQMYRRQVFGVGNNTVDAEGMVEVTLASSDGEWFTLRSYSDGTVLISSPKNGDEFKPYRSGWGFGRNGQELFRNLLGLFGN